MKKWTLAIVAGILAATCNFGSAFGQTCNPAANAAFYPPTLQPYPLAVSPGYPAATAVSRPIVPLVAYPPAAGYVGRPIGPAYPPPVPATAYNVYRPTTPPPGGIYYGRGLIGQPKAYVSGQPIRNALRFLTP